MLTLLTEEEIIDIYNEYMKEDFPPDELKPLSSMLEMLKRGIYACYGIYEGKTLLAYAYLTLIDNLVLVDYLAVVKDFRGSGIGTKFLTELKSILADKTIVIECENPNFATDCEDKNTRVSRINFYKNCDFVLSGVSSKLFGVEYVILTFPKCQNTAQALEKIYLKMLSKESIKKNLIIKS